MAIHIVQAGDTVYSIARQYGVSAQRILSDNGILNPRQLAVGQALLILFPQTVYTVRQGDTLYSIARQFGTQPMTLMQYNPEVVDTPVLRPGQTLAIRFSSQPQRQLRVNGYAYPYIQRNVLRRALPYLTTLTIFGYGFTEQGDLIGINDQPLINQAYEFAVAPVMLISSITEDGTFSGGRAKMLFENEQLQNRVIDNILAVMRQKGYLGLDVDFEYIEPEDADAYLRFVQNVTARMHAAGFFVNIDLAPKTSSVQRGLLYEAHNYETLGAVPDTVLLMTYEWGYTYGPPMAVAPLDRVRQVVEYAVTQIPTDKIMMGIPNYGYDWPLPFVQGTTAASIVGNEEAVRLAARTGAQILYDETAQSPYFEYYAQNRVEHIVWFEDIRSITAKLNLADEFSVLGVGYWNLMRPFAQNFMFLATQYQIQKIVV